MNTKRVGVDLAKQVFQVHGVDTHERVVCRRELKRAHVLDFFRQLTPCVVAMEACGSAHYWARELRKLGHDARLIAPGSSSLTSRVTSMMRMTPKRSVKQPAGQVCATFR